MTGLFLFNCVPTACYTGKVITMKILVTNDDGINAESLWILAGELKKIGDVVVMAPDSERSAIGTAVSLFKPLHVKEVTPLINGVTAYSTDGTPSDCVILAHGKLVPDINIVVSGINPGPNFGEDVYISGTVGAAMQGYTRGLPALAVSAVYPNNSVPRPGVILPVNRYALEAGARVAAALVKRMAAEGFPRIFLNLNVPDLPIEKVGAVKLTRLARSSHINTITEENKGPVKHYLMVRERIVGSDAEGTDIQAVLQGNMSLTPLYTSLLEKPPQKLLKKLAAGLLNEAKK
jgi:5'-nucleotidase